MTVGEYTRVTRHASIRTPAERADLKPVTTPGGGSRFSGITVGDMAAFVLLAREARLPSQTHVRVEPDESSSAFNPYTIKASETFSPEEWADLDKKYELPEDSAGLVEQTAQILKQARDECLAIPEEVGRTATTRRIMANAAQRVVELLGVR